MDCSCQSSIVGNNMVCFVLLELFQVMNLANTEIDTKFLGFSKMEVNAQSKVNETSLP